MSIQNLFSEGTTVISSQYLPQGADGSQTLSSILENGSDGGGNNIMNIGQLTMSNYLSTTSQIHFNDSSNNSHQFFQDGSNNFYLTFYPSGGNGSYKQAIVYNPNSNTLTLLGNSSAPHLKVGSNGGNVYDSVYNLPPSLQPAITTYYQSFNMTTGNINLVPITNSTLSTVFLGTYNFSTILNLFPNCNHFKLTINGLSLFSITGTEPGTLPATLYLTDVFPFSSIVQTDLNKNYSYAPISIDFSNSNITTLTDLPVIDFFSNAPQYLNLVLAINSADIGDVHFNRMSLNMSLEADDGTYTFLTPISS